VRAAFGNELVDPGVEGVLLQQPDQVPALARGVKVAVEPGGVDQGRGLGFGHQTVQQPPVHADIVPDDDPPVQAVNDLSTDVVQGGRGEQDVAGEFPGDPWAGRDQAAGVDRAVPGGDQIRKAAVQRDNRDLQDLLAVTILAAGAFQVEGHKRCGGPRLTRHVFSKGGCAGVASRLRRRSSACSTASMRAVRWTSGMLPVPSAAAAITAARSWYCWPVMQERIAG
jgi:hypothetical protein